MSLLWLLCHYYITFSCRFNARPPKIAKFALDTRVSFSMYSMSSLAVVFFLRPFLWGILAFRIIVETVCKPFTLFHSKWETKLWYQGQLNHPTPRMTETNYYVVFYPMCLGRPCIRRSLRLWKERGLCYSFILFNIVCHFSMVTSQKHHYTNKPTSQYSFIIAYVAILMAREGMYFHVERFVKLQGAFGKQFLYN